MQLWQEIQDGILQERWPKGKVATTKAEEVEARQLTMMSYLVQDVPDTFDTLLKSKDWNEVEFIRTKDG